MANKNLYDVFLKHLCTGQGMITVFLTNGVKLSGVVTAYDDTCLTLTRDGVTQLVSRNAISTVMPQEEFQIQDIM